MKVTVFVFFGGCFLVGRTSAEPPIINNSGGTSSPKLKEKEKADKCVYLLDIDPDAVNCDQTSAYAQFALVKRETDPDFCVYFLANKGDLSLTSYTVTFDCDDGEGNTTSGDATIEIEPNVPPIFAEGPTASPKTADASAVKTGDSIFTVGASDADGDALTYSLKTAVPEFDIDPASGSIIAKVDFDRVSTTPFTFTVEVTDSYHTAVEQAVTLTLTNINTAPQITNIVDPVSIDEDVAPGVVLYACTHDETGTVTKKFAVEPVTQLSVFDFNEAACEISVKAGQKLDFETMPTMNMTLTLNDGVFTSSFPFTFNVQDVNEPPAFASNSYTMDIFEGPLPVTPAVQPAFTVIDEDAGESKTFSLGTGTYDSYFTIDGTGALTCVTELDYDAGIKQVIITVIGTDKGGETATTSLTVNVADYNDNDPEFAAAPTTLFVSPKTSVEIIGQVVATDKDEGDNAKLTYSIVSDSSGGKFQINPTDGTIYLAQKVTEADRNDVYTVVVRATDSGAGPRTGDTTVTIKFDEPPIINNLPNFADVTEDTKSRKEVFRVNVTDNGIFVCEASRVTPVTTDTAFAMDRNTGGSEWYVVYTGPHALSHTQSPFTVDVVCTDTNGGKSTVKSLTINIIQNQPPTIDCTQKVIQVDASTTVAGDTVHNVNATNDGPITYQLIPLSPSSQTFYIDQGGNVKCSKQLLRETPSQYISVIKVSDSYGSASCTITLTMTNTNEAPTFSNLNREISVPEDLASGSLIYKATVVDTQACDPYSFILDVIPVQEEDKFTANITGKVVSLFLSAHFNLDFESVKKYTFYYRSKDGCLESQINWLDLIVTDVNEQPVFSNGDKYTIHFNEAGSPPANLGCGGQDPDVSDTFTLTLNGAQSNLFTITDFYQCIISPKTELDLDTGVVPDNFQMTMMLTDAAGLSATATVSVIVHEINDNPPVCNANPFTFDTIYNGDVIGRTLGTVTARDDDIRAVNRDLTYSIVSSSNVVDCKSDGTFTLAGYPEVQGLVPGRHDFTVKVTDQGNPSLSAQCDVTLMYVTTTTTTPPPTTPPPTTVTTLATAATTDSTGVSGNTMSPVEKALSNPVILGIIGAAAALLALCIIAGIGYCCVRWGPCGNGSSPHPTKTHDSHQRQWPRREEPAHHATTPTNNRAYSAGIASVNEVQPSVDPTSMKYL